MVASQSVEEIDSTLVSNVDKFSSNKWSIFCENLFSFLIIYKEILDSYVLDFYSEHLWNSINIKWRNIFEKFSPLELSNFLNRNSKLRSNSVLPLSLISFRATCFAFTLPCSPINPTTDAWMHVTKQNTSTRYSRECPEAEKTNVLSDLLNFGGTWETAAQEISTEGGQHHRLEHVFRKHLKPKKQHEVVRMAQLSFRLCCSTEANLVVDVGSGQGHLARLIGYGFGIPTICLDSEETFLKGARKFDLELERCIKKTRKEGCEEKTESVPAGTRHGTCHLNPQMHGSSFSKLLKKTWPELHKRSDSGEKIDVPFVLVGLHCCGDLSPTLIRLFSSIPACRALILVGCCYMKLTTESCISGPEGYPMSSLIKSKVNNALSYTSREVACHALEGYVEKLQKGSDNLKIHCYRSVLEELIVAQRPDLKHSGLRSVKNAHLLPFKDYVSKAIARLEGVSFTEDELTTTDIESKLKDWMKVVIFYSLRLMMAPVVETIILLDRLLFLHEESNSKCFIAPIFDPKLSPRNYALIASKGKVNR